MGDSSLQSPRPSQSLPAEWFINGAEEATRPLSAWSTIMTLEILLGGSYTLATSYLSRLCLAISTIWLFHRAFQVLNKPLDELVGLLGFEIPQGPRIDLAGIKADNAFFHWKPAEDRRSSHKYEVQVNGNIVGELSVSDGSFTLANLHPDQNYVVRIIVVNALDFRSASEPIRLRTNPASSGEILDSAAFTNTTDSANESLPSAPILRPHKTITDSTATPAIAPAMTRETSNGPGAPKRNVAGRRHAPSIGLAESSLDVYESENPGIEETQQQLTERLEEIARETAEAERQSQEEELEAATAKAELIKERDYLRANLKEKETTSKEYKKQVSALERENTAAQSKKSAQERALQQKKNERQRLKDDTERWAREIEEMADAVAGYGIEKARLLAEAERERLALQDKQAEEVQALRQMEEEIKEKASQIKRLERGNSESPINGEVIEQNDSLLAQEAEEDHRWTERMMYLDEQYKIAWQNMEAAKRLCADASFQMDQVRMRQVEYSQMSHPVNQNISRASSLRQRRNGSGSVATSGPAVTGFPASAAAVSFSNAMSTLPEGFVPSSSPFFNITNGMTLDRPIDGVDMSQADLERLTGGAPMSPGAGAELLPAGLLTTADEDLSATSRNGSAGMRGADSNDDHSDRQPSSVGPTLPGLGAFASNFLPGLGASQVQLQDRGPASPSSVSSRSPSVLASPGASAHNLPYPAPEYPMDSDGRSIHSSRSNRAGSSVTAPSGSRFSQILGLDKLNRQRGKTMQDSGPAFGTLSKTQSQSMPRDGQSDEGFGSWGRRRNSSHSGNFFGSVLSRGSTATKTSGADQSAEPKAAPARRRPFFSSKDGWSALLGDDNRPASPRQGSAHSSELPRPSADSSQWGVWNTSESFGLRASPLGTEWAKAQGQSQTQPGALSHSRSWGSRHPSRRQSVQYGGSGGVSYDIMEDDADLTDDYDDQPSIQAPIGTKPSSTLERPVTPRLNPAAKDFKSLFNAFGEKTKSEKSSKGKGKERDLNGTPRQDGNGATPIAGSSTYGGDTTSAHAAEDDLSPARSRLSRDTRSVTTAESSVNESVDRNSLERSLSHPASDAPTPSSYNGSVSKESFMQKLSRKTSTSGKFGLPSFTREKRHRNTDRAKETPVGEEADEDDVLSASVDSMPGRDVGGSDKRQDKASTMRSWSSVFTGKIGKGKEKTPSISEASMSTEATGEDDEDDD